MLQQAFYISAIGSEIEHNQSLTIKVTFFAWIVFNFQTNQTQLRRRKRDCRNHVISLKLDLSSHWFYVVKPVFKVQALFSVNKPKVKTELLFKSVHLWGTCVTLVVCVMFATFVSFS